MNKKWVKRFVIKLRKMLLHVQIYLLLPRYVCMLLLSIYCWCHKHLPGKVMSNYRNHHVYRGLFGLFAFHFYHCDVIESINVFTHFSYCGLCNGKIPDERKTFLHKILPMEDLFLHPLRGLCAS